MLGDLYHSTRTNYEDGTWMIVRIRIPQTILIQEYSQTINHLLNDGNIHGQIEASIGTSNFPYNKDKCDENSYLGNTSDNLQNDCMK